MTEQDREQAGAFALAIEHGLLDVRGVMDWACDVVAVEASPSEDVLELAGAIRPSPVDVARMLRAIAGSPDRNAVFRKFLAIVRDAVRARANLWPLVAGMLERLAIRGQVPGPLEGQCYNFDDQRFLAEDGSYGTLDAVEADLRAFLETESEPSVHTALVARATRFVDDAQPGWVECEVTDANGDVHRFREKVPVVTSEDLNASTVYPYQVTLACEIRGQRLSSAGLAAVEVDTSKPWGIESTEGTTRFLIAPRLLVTADRTPSNSGVPHTPLWRSLGQRG